MYLGVLPSSPWQHQRIWPESPEFCARAMDPSLYEELARDCDAAGLDFLFLPDKHVANASPPDPSIADSWFEPITLLSYLAAVTSRIGLVPTMSTTWYEPFPLARQILSLDHLSHGRAGWNAVSSHPGLEQSNFAHRPATSREQMKTRHAEAVALVKHLWESWAADAVVADPEHRRWFRPGAVHPVDHHGEHFDVSGALTLQRSPQGRPVVVMAGASDSFLRTAANDADVVFTALNDIDTARTTADTLRAFAAEAGRTGANAPRLMPGFFLSSCGFPEFGSSSEQQVPGLHFHSPASSDPASGAHVAADMVRIADKAGLDGFILMPRAIPEDIRFLCDEVLPELVALGARPRLSGTSTLRANLGL
ncbi:LLM class flavin-dependent oxidoreductase [Corynebacterium glyciniphilum]|uniref:LLM class flavin-dependent oxidoreductase n=1 Tax=Corynebacterium glyciniphilum TaxID=1404244 RepID=UPI003FD3C297